MRCMRRMDVLYLRRTWTRVLPSRNSSGEESVTVDLVLAPGLLLRADLYFERGDPDVGINDGWLYSGLWLVVDDDLAPVTPELEGALWAKYRDRLAEAAEELRADEP